MARKSTVAYQEELLTTAAVAALLNVNVNTVRRWSDSRLLPSYRIGARGDRRFRRADVENMLQQGPARREKQLVAL